MWADTLSTGPYSFLVKRGCDVLRVFIVLVMVRTLNATMRDAVRVYKSSGIDRCAHACGGGARTYSKAERMWESEPKSTPILFLLFSFSLRGFFCVEELCAAVGDVRSVARHHRDAIVDWAHADAERASSAVGGDFGDVRVGRERDGLVARVVARHVALTWGHQCLQTRR